MYVPYHKDHVSDHTVGINSNTYNCCLDILDLTDNSYLGILYTTEIYGI